MPLYAAAATSWIQLRNLFRLRRPFAVAPLLLWVVAGCTPSNVHPAVTEETATTGSSANLESDARKKSVAKAKSEPTATLPPVTESPRLLPTKTSRMAGYRSLTERRCLAGQPIAR